MKNEGKLCPQCKVGHLIFGTFDMYCSEYPICKYREPHEHGPGPYICTCGPKLLGPFQVTYSDECIAGTAKTIVFVDKLDELFKLQKDFQDKYGYWPDLHDICSAGASEFLELWAKSGGKWWKKHKASEAEQIDELVDILHFFLLACLKLKVTPFELVNAYKLKLDINVKRQENNY